MKITYDSEANASYFYFTVIAPGAAVDTRPFQPLEVDLDKRSQIVAMRLLESANCRFGERLKYALQHPQITYDPIIQAMKIEFVPYIGADRTIFWDANIDLDRTGQMLGFEVLFGYASDGQEALDADGKLEYLSPYIVEL
jgi:uncharacterized protein YuzE